MKDHKKENSISLSSLRISLLYIGVLMGAGFASGKEIWQFFGVFGGNGLFGIILISGFFISLGFIIVSIGRALDTGDLSKIIVPFSNRLVENIIGGVVASFIFLGYFSMLAAGGAIAQEQLGIHRSIGSFILMVLVVLTIIKGFSRVSARLGKVVPVLLITTFVLVFFIITKYFDNISMEQVVTASPLAPNWFISAIIFGSYNLMVAIPILGSCAVYSDTEKIAKRGALLGGIFLGFCALSLYFTTLTDPKMAEASPLPMLSLSLKISPVAQTIYSVVLLIAVFGTATSCFYGFCTKLPDTRRKNYFIWISAILGFGLSLFGFSNIVAFLYPIEGYISLLILLLMIWNYVRIKLGKR